MTKRTVAGAQRPHGTTRTALIACHLPKHKPPVETRMNKWHITTDHQRHTPAKLSKVYPEELGHMLFQDRQTMQRNLCQAPKRSLPNEKADCKQRTNYRGISLLSLPGKVHAKCLERKCREIVESKLEDGKYSFRPGRSTTDQYFTLKQICEKSEEKNFLRLQNTRIG